jgi:adenylate kinase family enzyme
MPRRIAVISTTSGQGKSTLAGELGRRLGVPHVEIDALHHGPGWVEASAQELRARVLAAIEEGGWVVDGNYQGKLGTLVLDRADTVVWLDLPLHVWLPRLWSRTRQRIRGRVELWNGNRETWRGAFLGWNSLFVYALRNVVRRRRRWPAALAGRSVVRLRSPAEVERWLAGFPLPQAAGAASTAGMISEP